MKMGKQGAAGVSPTSASPATIPMVDLLGTAFVLEEFRNVIACGGAGVAIAPRSGHRLPAPTPDQDKTLAPTSTDDLLAPPMLQPYRVTDSLHGYQIAKRGNSLRVMAEAAKWAKRSARANTIRPGIMIAPLVNDEPTGPLGAGYTRMIALSAVGRTGIPDEVGNVGARLMGPDGAFITGSDFRVTAAYRFGDLAPK
jgi:NAD(P)-dependent dehydrogenase (short-subunit alcohol dehydrogenase family)